MKFEEGVTTRTPPQFCPLCFTVLDAVASLETKKVPDPGDFTICLYCAAVLKFGPDMMLEASSLMDIPMHSRKGFAEGVMAAKELIERRRGRGRQ
jgi:hypothetical protein